MIVAETKKAFGVYGAESLLLYIRSGQQLA